MLRSAPTDLELSQRVFWLIQLRWLAASAVICGTFVATGVIGLPLDPVPLYLVGAGIALYNSGFIVLSRSAEASAVGKVASARVMANTQIVVDLVFLTLLIHLSGGVENPIAFYFIFHIIIASILLSRRETILQATVANVLFWGMVVGEAMGAIPHVHLFGAAQPDMARDWLHVGSTLLVFSSTLYLAAYMATSITGRLRQREQEIMRLTGQLESKAEELEDAYNRLAELERMKSEQMGRVSREIKAPLAAIQSSLKSVLDGLAGEVSAKQREMIVRAERRAEGLLDLVSDLLVLSRARELRLVIARRLVDPLEIARKVLATHGPAAANRDVALLSELVEGVPPICADPEALEQLLANLVANAVDYTPSGGRVELKVDSVGEAVRFRVKDSGIGIASADLPRIFNEFYRAENARRFSEGGTGLGLAIVRSIVETDGGAIDVDSQVGVGTTFTVLLPRGSASCDREDGEAKEQLADVQTVA